MTSWTDAQYQHLTYVGRGGHIYELFYRLGHGPWGWNDLTDLTGAPPAALPEHTSWVDADYQHVVYTGDDGHVHELFYHVGSGPWLHNDLNGITGAPPTDGRVTIWADADYQHIAYADNQEMHVYELFYRLGSGPWQYNDLTAITGAPPVADPHLTVWVDADYQHIAYLGQDDCIHELFYRIGSGPWLHNDLTSAAGAPPV